MHPGLSPEKPEESPEKPADFAGLNLSDRIRRFDRHLIRKCLDLPRSAPGWCRRSCERIVGNRVLEAVSRAQITLRQVQNEEGRVWLLRALPMLCKGGWAIGSSPRRYLLDSS